LGSYNGIEVKPLAEDRPPNRPSSRHLLPWSFGEVAWAGLAFACVAVSLELIRIAIGTRPHPIATLASSSAVFTTPAPTPDRLDRVGTSATERLKLMSAAVLQYASDFDEAYPVGSGPTYWQQGDGGWFYSLQAYLPTEQSWVDPKDRWGNSLWPDWIKKAPGIVPMSLASNGYIKHDGKNWGMYGLVGIDQAGPSRMGGIGWLSKGRATASEVRRPNDTVLFAERFGSYAGFGGSDIFTGVNWWDSMFGVGGLIPDGTKAGGPSKQPPRTGRGYLVNGTIYSGDNRNGGMNAAFTIRARQAIAFADGHVAMMRPLETNPDSVARPERNKWDIEH
jgi:hypothetical protein